MVGRSGAGGAGWDLGFLYLRFLCVSAARNQGFDVVLVDTAGRMQDNAPLMTALAKLIAVNAPDLVLFVGEALVGNEAVDQLVSVRSCFLGRADLCGFYGCFRRGR